MEAVELGLLLEAGELGLEAGGWQELAHVVLLIGVERGLHVVVFEVGEYALVRLELALSSHELVRLLLLGRHHLEVEHDLLDIVHLLVDGWSGPEALDIVEVETAHILMHLLASVIAVKIIILVWYENRRVWSHFGVSKPASLGWLLGFRLIRLELKTLVGWLRVSKNLRRV